MCAPDFLHKVQFRFGDNRAGISSEVDYRRNIDEILGPVPTLQVQVSVEHPDTADECVCSVVVCLVSVSSAV